MKIKKSIICIIIFIVLCGLLCKSFATDEIQEEGTIETLNPSTENPTEDNPINNNNNENNEQANQENTNIEPTNQEDSSLENNENNDETQIINSEDNNYSTQKNNNYYISTNNNFNTNSVVQSSNANLKYLTVDVEGLSPEFDKSITEYYLTVDLSVENINVEALTEDVNAQVTILGNDSLIEGENTIQVLVKAENGNINTYSIYVTKTDDVEKVNANLKTLSVNGFNIYPSFKANIYNYSLTITEKILELEILVETENEEATFEILGNENLKEGNNLIKVIVTAKDRRNKKRI